MSELIENETIPVAPNEFGDFLNRSSSYCRDVVESHDWFILFDICTDQILVLDLSTGWLDVKRITFNIHQNSLNQGIKNYEKLRDGNLLKDDELFVFPDILNGSNLYILNLETENVRIIETNLNTLFFEKFITYSFFDIKNNKENIINIITNNYTNSFIIETKAHRKQWSKLRGLFYQWKNKLDRSPHFRSSAESLAVPARRNRTIEIERSSPSQNRRSLFKQR
jgi:hypothetical protein